MCAVTMTYTIVAKMETVESVVALTVWTLVGEIKLGIVATCIGIDFHIVFAGRHVHFGIEQIPDGTFQNHSYIVCLVGSDVSDCETRPTTSALRQAVNIDCETLCTCSIYIKFYIIAFLMLTRIALWFALCG